MLFGSGKLGVANGACGDEGEAVGLQEDGVGDRGCPEENKIWRLIVTYN